MASKAYPPAQRDAIGMADALDHDEPLDIEDGLPKGGGVKIRDHVTLKPSPTFQPSFGQPQKVKMNLPPRNQEPPPMTFAPGLPRDARQVQAAKAKLAQTGITTAEPERELPKHPEAKKVTVADPPPAIGSLVTNIPTFAQKLYGDNAPQREHADPLAVHGKDAHKLAPPPTVVVHSAPPPIQGRPPPPPAAAIPPPPQQQPVIPAAPVAAPAATEIPKNAKKVITTTTTTTKIVDGKEVVETHVHHEVIVKKKMFGMPKLLKNLGKKKTTTTTTTTTTSS